jgi:hypothetical protein
MHNIESDNANGPVDRCVKPGSEIRQMAADPILMRRVFCPIDCATICSSYIITAFLQEVKMKVVISRQNAENPPRLRPELVRL